jgi:hypothetical protein
MTIGETIIASTIFQTLNDISGTIISSNNIMLRSTILELHPHHHLLVHLLVHLQRLNGGSPTS